MNLFKSPISAVLWISLALLLIVVISPLGVDDLVWRSITLDFYRLGRIPYIGSWDHNFPGIMLIQYLSIVFFGENDIGLRIFDVILQLAFIVVFYKLCRFWLRERTAAIAALLYVIYYVTGRGSLYCERDVYGGMAIVAALYIIIRSGRINPNAQKSYGEFAQVIISGLLAGFTILIRPTFGLAYVLLAVFLLTLKSGKSQRRNSLAPTILYALAGAAPFIALLLAYSTIPGGLQALYLSTIKFNIDVYAAIHGEANLLVVLVIFFWRGFLVPLAIFGLIAIRKNSNHNSHTRQIRKQIILRSLSRSELLLYCSLLFSFLGISFIQGNYLAYHFAPFYLLLCPISAIGVEWVLAHVRGWMPRTAIVLVFGSIYSFFLIGDRTELAAFATALIRGRNPFAAAYAGHNSGKYLGANLENSVIQYLSLAGNDTGSVEVCSFEPVLRTHLRRKFASIYVLPSAIALGIDTDKLGIQHFTDYQIAWRRAYIDSLNSNKPHFIILVRNTNYWHLHDPYSSYLHRLPGFDSLLQTSYRYDTAFGAYQIFRRIGE